MNKRIYRTFIGLTLPALLFLAVVLSVFYYDAWGSREKAAIRDSANLIADFVNHNMPSEEFSDYLTGGSFRLTIVAADGTVLVDNVTGAATLENHSGREEIQVALQAGEGEATRYSDTISADTYYYAVRLENGDVLRLSKRLESITGIFTSSLPVVIGVTILLLLAANYLARRFTVYILAPLTNIDLESDNIAVYDELAPYVRKIDNQKREIAAQISALQHRTDTIEAIVEHMREGLLLLDDAAIVVTANKSAADIFGEAQPTGQNILHICRDIELQHGVKTCLAGENAELQLVRGDRTYGVYCSPVPGKGGGAVILLLDMTEKLEAERQRREFSANVSHELKTPLASISALSEMIESGMAKTEDVQPFAARISQQAGRLIRIIEDIIRLSEFDEAAVTAEMTEFDLRDLAQSVINTLADNEKGVTLSLVGERILISANQRMLDELLYNLCDNAVKYNKENGSVAVSLAEEGGFARIAVSDTGIGIADEHHSRVFERFYRADKSRSKKTGGTGLGLSIVKHIAAHHGGRVELTSEPGVGTMVVCWVRVKN
jgi:two-component system phosphate regulon sensor histidine kinase PhoR